MISGGNIEGTGLFSYRPAHGTPEEIYLNPLKVPLALNNRKNLILCGWITFIENKQNILTIANNMPLERTDLFTCMIIFKDNWRSYENINLDQKKFKLIDKREIFVGYPGDQMSGMVSGFIDLYYANFTKDAMIILSLSKSIEILNKTGEEITEMLPELLEDSHAFIHIWVDFFTFTAGIDKRLYRWSEAIMGLLEPWEEGE